MINGEKKIKNPIRWAMVGRRLNIDFKAIPDKKSGMAIFIYICIKQSYCLSLSV
ncbi:hypothetical protein [Halalkalibacter flavus]|uniref:hypothetical protein n=1 Tax=Halalkalibacter flavus TaxID=3090668 RepID=UPI002FC82A9C